MRILTMMCAAVLCAGAAIAEPVSGRTAAGQLIETSGIGLQLSRSLSEKEGAIIQTLVPLIEQQMGTKAKFYGTIAYAPDEGLVSEALQGAFNHHSVAAADAAALAACTAAKTTSGLPCQVAARILPPGYTERELSLSHDATQAFFGQYLSSRGKKVFAVSRTTGAWAMGPSDAGALAACARDARGVNDCEIIVRD